MDESLLRRYIWEVHLQCRLALRAFDHIGPAGEAMVAEGERRRDSPSRESPFDRAYETDMVELFSQAFLSHAASASRILWPGSARKPLTLQEVQERGETIRRALNVPDSMILINRDLRDHMAHYDERMQAWEKVDAPTHLRSRELELDYSANTVKVVFNGTTYDLMDMANALVTLYERCDEWFAADAGRG